MSGILFRDTKVSWGVCTRRVRLEEGFNQYRGNQAHLDTGAFKKPVKSETAAEL